MGKCNLCGKQALEVVKICPECLQRAEVDPNNIRRLRQISDILSITPDTDTNIKRCMQGILEIAEDLERSGTGGKEKEEIKGAAVPEKE